MRSFGPIVALLLLTSCGSQGAENGSGPNADPVANGLGEAANSAVDAEPNPAAEANTSAGEVASVALGPCLTQGTEQLEARPLRAVGTEPFWSARIEGRCVTYSTPEDQQGVRVWTRYSAGPNGAGSWIGQLDGKPFELKTRPESACSDGMSDKGYPIAVELMVKGEQRQGCAEPL